MSDIAIGHKPPIAILDHARRSETARIGQEITRDIQDTRTHAHPSGWVVFILLELRICFGFIYGLCALKVNVTYFKRATLCK